MVKREDVLKFVLERGYTPFTTTDIAEILGCKEYAVRGAVSWLICGGFVRFHSWHKEREHVKLYAWSGKSGEITKVRRNIEERRDQEIFEKGKTAGEAALALQRVLEDMRRGTKLSIGEVAKRVKGIQ